MSSQIDAFNDLAWRLRFREGDRALRLSQHAHNLSQSGEFAEQNYLPGLASSLAISGFIHQLAYDFDKSMNDSLQALAILDGLPVLPASSDARMSICWINIYIGDYSTAMNYALAALKIARKINNLERQAYALDSLGNIYCKSTEYDHALESHMEAVHIAEEIGIPELGAVLYNNLANTLYEMGHYAEAHPYAWKALQLATEQGLVSEKLIVKTTMSEILTGMKSFDEAGFYLQESLDEYHHKGLSKPFVYMQILFDLANLNIQQKKYQVAEPYLLKVLETATQFDYKQTLVFCHQKLCDIYENTNQFQKALEHYKQFHELQSTVSGKDMARKITLLKAEYQMEFAQIESESYRLQNLELQHEIEERKRIEALLENLAIRDSLTNLFNRRQFSILAAAEFERSIRHKRPLCVMLLDIDHFKQVNDRYGHQMGDQVLVSCAKIVQSTLRDSSDILGRYGGEEFIAILSETNTTQAIVVAERLRKFIGEIYYGDDKGSFSVTVSIGISEFSGIRAEVPNLTLNEVIHQADQALYAAKKAGRNRVEQYKAA